MKRLPAILLAVLLFALLAVPAAAAVSPPMINTYSPGFEANFGEEEYLYAEALPADGWETVHYICTNPPHRKSAR